MTTRTPEEVRQERIQSWPVKHVGLLERALRGEASPRQAIKAKCLECCGNVRADVVGCTSYGCPLYAYRPYQPQ